MIRPAAAAGQARGLRRVAFEEIPALVLGVGKESQRQQADDEIGLDHLIRPLRYRPLRRRRPGRFRSSAALRSCCAATVR